MGAVRFMCAAIAFASLLLHGAAAPATRAQQPPDAAAIIRGAIDHWRGASSYALVAMTVHRPAFERTSVMRIWTRGDKDALVRFVEPARSAGDATLKRGDDMWVFTPRLNRVVKIPFSMMAASWMGSDFSYTDLSKSDELVVHFDSRVVGTELHDGHTVFIIEATPHASAPVIWGKALVKVRDDDLLIEETFFDQDARPVKRLSALEIGTLGGRRYVVRLRMTKIEEPDTWTELVYREATFGRELPDGLFTQSNLRNPRAQWEQPQR